MSTYVGQLMSSPVETVERGTTAKMAAQQCLDEDVNSLLVVDDNGLFYGIVTATDLVAVVAADDQPSETVLDDYVTTDVATVTTNTLLRDAADVLLENDIHHLPVLSSSQEIRGVLSTADVAQFLSNTREYTP